MLFFYLVPWYCKYFWKPRSNENLEAKVGSESGFPQIENDMIIETYVISLRYAQNTSNFHQTLASYMTTKVLDVQV